MFYVIPYIICIGNLFLMDITSLCGKRLESLIRYFRSALIRDQWFQKFSTLVTIHITYDQNPLGGEGEGELHNWTLICFKFKLTICKKSYAVDGFLPKKRKLRKDRSNLHSQSTFFFLSCNTACVGWWFRLCISTCAWIWLQVLVIADFIVFFSTFFYI